jgi:hypothetical protein
MSLCAGKFRCDLGLQDIILEGESSQVVNAVNAIGPNWCMRYRQLVVDIRIILSARQVWQVRHIRRVTNFTTHKLVKAAAKQIMNRV